MNAGTLEILLLANMARLQADMDQAMRAVGGAMATINQSVKVAAGALAALGVGMSASVFIGWIRGAINAADETSKLSQRIGVAVKDVAGLQLAFRQAGVGDAFAASMAKMAKSAADGSKAFDAMGISTRAADGTLKTTRQLLGEVADKMATYQDSAAKSALAQEIFGKSGAQLIPLLNAGAKGLEEYDAMAQKLGLTLDENTAKEAEKFNDTLDLIGQGTQGVARQISAQLLPTLTGLAGQFFDSMTAGDKLKKTADFLASALKVLYIAGLAVVESFKTVGNVLGGVSAAVVAALAGDFGVAKNILKAIKTDVSESWKETAAQMGNAWTTTGNAAVESMAATSAAMKKAAPVAADMEKASKAAAKAAEDALKAAQKQWEELVKTIVKNDEATNKWLDQNSRTLDGLIEGNEALRQQNEAIGLNTAATDALTLSRMDAAIAQAQLNLIDAQNIEGNAARVDQIEREIRLLKERKELTAAGQVATAAAEAQKSAKEAAEKAAKEAADAWQKSADEINQSLTDALMDAFMAGKGFGKTFVDSIKAMFNSMVLKPVISAIVSPVASAVTGGLGFSGAANAGSSLGGVGNLGSLGSLLGSGGSFSAGIGAGVGSLIGEAGLMGGMDAGIIALQAGNIAGGLGTLVGVLGPIALGIGAVYALAKNLDHSGTPHTGGGSQYSAAGGLLDARTSTFASGFTGIDYSDSTTEFTAGIVQSVVGILDSTATTFGKTAGYTAAASFADDSSKDGAWGSLRIADAVGNALVDWQSSASFRTFSDGTAGNNEFLAAIGADLRPLIDALDLPGWASDALNALGDAPGLDQLAATVAQINATQTALVAMGKNLVGFAAMSDTAVQALITASGGINTLAASASSYYDNFYTDAEKQAVTMASLADGFAAINVAMPTTRDEFRQTVEALQAATGENPYAAPALASVLSMSAAFASVVPAAEAAGSTVVDTVEDMLTLGAALNALRNPVRTIEDVAKSLFGLEQAGASLQVELLSARGDTEGAKALQRSLDTAGFTDAEVALYDYNTALQAQIDTLISASEAATESAAAAATVADNLANSLQALQNTSAILEVELLRAQGDTSGADALQRAIETAGFSDAELAIYNYNTALSDQIKTINDANAVITAAESAAAAAAAQRDGLESTLLRALGETATLRQRELAALDPSNRALQSMIYTVTDAQSAISGLTTDIARLDQIAAQASNLSASIGVALGGPDNTESNLWATVNNASAAAEDRLTAVGSLINSINSSISTDTAAAQKALTDGAAASQAAIESANTAMQAGYTAQIEAAEKMVDLGKTLRDYVQGLLVGSLSALTPEQQLAQARQDYEQSLSGARAGDADAQAALTGNATTYLELARSFDAESYRSVFADVTGTLGNFGTSALTEGQQAAQAAQSQIDALTSISGYTSQTTAAVLTGNVISDANRAALESLLGITAQIEAAAVIDRADKQAQITVETERMEASRASLSDDGVIATSSLTTAGVMTSFAAQQASDNATLVGEIKSLNARIAQLEATIVSATGAQIQTAVTVGQQTAQAVSTAVSVAVDSAANAPVVA